MTAGGGVAGQEVRDLLIRLRSDATEVETGNRKAQQSFTELNQKLELAQKAFSAIGTAYSAFSTLLDRGQSVSEISAAFDNLSQRAGASAESGLQRLNDATSGLISNFDLMRASNEALIAGLSPEQFQKVAAAADQLGDAVGVSTKQALDDITVAMATGLTKGLERTYGLVIDNKKAQDDFAKSIGTTASALNEYGQRQAARIAIEKALEEQQTHTGKAAQTVGDEIQKLGNIADNVRDSFVKWLNEEPALVTFFQHLTTAANDFAKGLEVLFNTSGRAQLFNLQNQINAAQGAATPHTGLEGKLDSILGYGPTAENVAKVAELKQKYADLDQQLKEIGTTNKGIVTPSFVDQGRAAKDAADSADKAFEDSKQAAELWATNFINDLDNIPIVGKNASQIDYVATRLEEQFQKSVDFFGDILTPMFDDSAANLEGIFGDALKRVAIGFGSQILATLAQNVLPSINFGDIGSAQGLGGSLAKLLTGGLGGGGGAAVDPNFIGPTQAAGFSLTAFIPAIAASAAAAVAYSNKGVLQGGKLNLAGQAALAIPTAGLSFLYNDAVDFLGGDSKKAHEREARQGLFDQIFGDNGASFGGTNGQINLSSKNFNPSGKFGGQGTGLVNSFAQTLSGGDDKLGADLAGIFENGVTQGDNFNEVLTNTMALMDKLGTNAAEQKDAVTQLFLDGKISLDEFSTDLSNLNLIAQDNLVGTGSVSDALGIVAKNVDNPRVELKGLEFTFKELAEIGVTSTSQIHDYMVNHATPDMVQAFDKLAAAGIDTWEEIANATPDQLAVIFSAVQDLAANVSDTFQSVGDSISSGVKDGADDASNRLDRLRRDAENTGAAIRSAFDPANQGGSPVNPNRPNNVR